MNIRDYLEKKAKREALEKAQRSHCFSCFQPSFSCYCLQVRKFDPQIKFVILIHPIERRRRIATGRMTHLCLENSLLIEGEDFSSHASVNSVVEDDRYHSVILYPGTGSVDISKIKAETRYEIFPQQKKLAVFVIDGTWNTARKMVRSTNLKALPKICFTPSEPSSFRVRKQPKEGCVSTIEAVHETIELLGEGFGYSGRAHDNLLEVFDSLVEHQLKFITEVRSSRQAASKIARLQNSQNNSKKSA